MRISRKSDYALRAVRFLTTRRDGAVASINEIATAECVSKDFLGRILNDLASAGLLRAYRGIKGGYQLSRRPAEISFLDVMEAVDGPIKLSLASTNAISCPCGQKQVCALCHFWLAQERKLIGTLRKHTFARYRTAPHRTSRSARRA